MSKQVKRFQVHVSGNHHDSSLSSWLLKIRDRGRKKCELHQRFWEVYHSETVEMFDVTDEIVSRVVRIQAERVVETGEGNESQAIQTIGSTEIGGQSSFLGVDLWLSRGDDDWVEFPVFETNEVSDGPDVSSGSF